jgi:transposase InsO family protein
LTGTREYSPATAAGDKDSAYFPNLYRNVIPSAPDLVWVGDITFIRVETGFVYLAVILDACSRKVVGYSISRRIDTELTLAALDAAVQSRQPKPGTCIHHTDRGSQGGFNRSSQHWIVEQILDIRPGLPQASSSRVFSGPGIQCVSNSLDLSSTPPGQVCALRKVLL